MIAFFVASALAGGLHAGIDPAKVEGIGPVMFLSPQSGWTAPLQDGSGTVRVFVAHGVDEAATFYADAIEGRTTTQVRIGDMSVLVGMELYARDGNVVVHVTSPDALAIGTDVLGSIADFENWPSPPGIAVSGRNVRVEGPWVQVMYLGGDTVGVDGSTRRAVVTPSGRKSATVDTLNPGSIEVTGWDRYGRVGRATWLGERVEVAEPEVPAERPLAVPVD